MSYPYPEFKLPAIEECLSSTNPFIETQYDMICNELSDFSKKWHEIQKSDNIDQTIEAFCKTTSYSVFFHGQMLDLIRIMDEFTLGLVDVKLATCLNEPEEYTAHGYARLHCRQLLTKDDYTARPGMTAEETRKEDIFNCKKWVAQAIDHLAELALDCRKLASVFRDMLEMKAEQQNQAHPE